MGTAAGLLDRWLLAEIVRFGAAACLAIAAFLGGLMFATSHRGANDVRHDSG